MPLDQKIERSFRLLLKTRGKRVVYRRGEQSLDLVMIPGQTPFRFVDAQGSGSMRVVSRDWLVLREDLVLDGEAFEPARGDRIIETIKGVDHIWEVGSPADSDEPPFRNSDPEGVALRIHAKEVSQ